MIPGPRLRGLALEPELVHRILPRSYHQWVASRPLGTAITRTIDWQHMGVPRIERRPGERSPPP